MAWLETLDHIGLVREWGEAGQGGGKELRCPYVMCDERERERENERELRRKGNEKRKGM